MWIYKAGVHSRALAMPELPHCAQQSTLSNHTIYGQNFLALKKAIWLYLQIYFKQHTIHFISM
jgi:hypothetical protein